MDNISLLTYTHSKCTDLHAPYFGRIQKYFPQLIHNYVTSNEYVPYAKYIWYDDNSKHSDQMLNALNRIPTTYVMYSQEDYILFDQVKIEEIEKAIRVLETDPKIGFIRLIHSGLGFDKNRSYDNNYNYLDKSAEYYYSTQVTIWKKNILQQMFELSKVSSIFQEAHNSPYLKTLPVDGLYERVHGAAVGGHYNSYTYPYIATAKVKGEWNLKEYPNELNELFDEYKITTT